MLKLFGYWRSTAAYRVRIALNYKQVSYESVPVHLVKEGGEQHKPAYKALNPQELVPLLLDGDSAINQSMAIVEYLEEKYPTPALLPQQLDLRAKVRAACQMIACDIHPLNNLRVLQYLENTLGLKESVKNDWYSHWIRIGFEALETVVSEYSQQGRYCFGAEVSMADLFLVPQIYNARRFGITMDSYPHLSAINEQCLTRSFFRDAMPENQPDAVG